MRRLVEYDRQQQTGRGEGSHHPIACSSQARGDAWEHSSGEGPADKHREQQPGRVDADLEAEQGKQSEPMQKDWDVETL